MEDLEEDLEEAITYDRELLSLRPPGDPDRVPHQPCQCGVLLAIKRQV